MKSFVACTLVLFCATTASATTVLFDFGRTDKQTNPNWNNIVPATTTLFALFDSDGNLVPGNAGLEITDTFFQTGEPSQLGSEAPAGDAAAYPVNATDDYFFGHVSPFAGADANPLGQVKLFNLNPGNFYSFTFFASRQTVSDTRDARYTVKGASTDSAVLNASNNNTEVVRVLDIAPDGNNEIFVDVEPGPNNDNSVGFYYIGLMQVDIRPIPEPTTFAVLGTGLTAAAGRRQRRNLS